MFKLPSIYIDIVCCFCCVYQSTFLILIFTCKVVCSSRQAYSAEAASSRAQSAADEETAALRHEVLTLQQRLHDVTAAESTKSTDAIAAAALSDANAAKEALKNALAEREMEEKRASRAEAEATAAQDLVSKLGAELTELRASVRRLQRAAALQASPPTSSSSSSLSSPLRLSQPTESTREVEEPTVVVAAADGSSSHPQAESKLADQASRGPPLPLRVARSEGSRTLEGSRTHEQGVVEEKVSAETSREEKGSDGRRKEQRQSHGSSHSSHSNSSSSSHSNSSTHKSRSPVRHNQERNHRRAALTVPGVAGMRPPMHPPEHPPPPQLKPMLHAAVPAAPELSASAVPARREKQQRMQGTLAGPEVETNVDGEEGKAENELSPETADEWTTQSSDAARDLGDQSYGRTIFVAAKTTTSSSPKRISLSKPQGSPRAHSDGNSAPAKSVKSPPPPLPPRNRGLSPSSEKDGPGASPRC